MFASFWYHFNISLKAERHQNESQSDEKSSRSRGGVREAFLEPTSSPHEENSFSQKSKKYKPRSQSKSRVRTKSKYEAKGLPKRCPNVIENYRFVLKSPRW